MPLPKLLSGTSAAALLLAAMTCVMAPVSAHAEDRKIGIDEKFPTLTQDDKKGEQTGPAASDKPDTKRINVEDKNPDDSPDTKELIADDKKPGAKPVVEEEVEDATDEPATQPPPKAKAEEEEEEAPPPKAKAEEEEEAPPPKAKAEEEVEEEEAPPPKAKAEEEAAPPKAEEEEEAAAVDVYKPADELETKAQSVLDKACARCHQVGRLSKGKKKPAKGLGEILQLDALSSNPNYIVKGNPEGSKLFQTIVNKNMPYDTYQDGDYEAYAPSGDDIQVLRDWITKLSEKKKAACTTEEIYDPKQLVDMMYGDLSQLPDHEREYTRYISIAHLASACASKEELEVYRQGVGKLLNSLSMNSDVYELTTIDKEKLIIRFSLNDLNWTPELWEHIVKLYPYAVEPVNSQYGFLKQTTHTYAPYVRGDWLAFFASRPPLYEKILGLELTFQGLQKQLGLDTFKNISDYKVVRAGFKESGVSQHNRLIERHTISTGAFWTSYDFGGTKNEQNLLEYPLGPQGAFKSHDYGDKFAFHEDGGESIWNLPNGFQAYYLNDNKGKHLEKGPTQIVRDPDRVDLAVTNGISCMGCHDQGMKNATDEIGEHVGSNRIFPADVREAVKSIYPEKKEFDKYIDKDRARFITAMKSAGLDPGLKYEGSVEPVNALSNRYERDVDLDSAASEFGVSPEELKRFLPSASRTGASFSVQLEQGTVQRDIFEENFGDLVEGVIDAKYIAPDKEAPGYAEIKKREDVAYEPEGKKAEEYKVEKKHDEYTGDKPLVIKIYAKSTLAYVGDKPQFTVYSDYDCYLTLVNVDSYGEGTVIYPNKYEQNNFITGGKEFHYPAADAGYDFTYLNKGIEKVVAICDTKGDATAAIAHNFNEEEFTSLGKKEVASRKIDVVNRDKKVKAKKGKAVYTGVAQAAIKIEVQ